MLNLCSVHASATLVKVLDQHGMPLENAIIEIEMLKNEEVSSVATDTYIMDQVNKSFYPHVLTIPKNSVVNFPNSDNIRHHVYSFSKTKPFELKLYAGKSKKPVRFKQSGVVVLGCNIHDSMVGYIYVYANSTVYKTGINGDIHIPGSVQASQKIWLWHPKADKKTNYRKLIRNEKFINAHDVVTLKMSILESEPRDSFEDVFTNAH